MSESKVFKVCPTTEKALPEEPTGIIKAISDGSCKTGCGSMTRCICAYAEDMVDYAGKLRDLAAAVTAERDAMREDAELGQIAMRFVDRAGDVCDSDPAEKICQEFYEAIGAAIDAARKETP